MWPTASVPLSSVLWEGIPIHIQIGDVRTLEAENWQVLPDDRQRMVEIVGGMAVQDFGHVAQGDRISCTVTVLAADWEKIKRYWDEREKVDVTDEAGNVWHNMRVTVKAYAYVPHFSKAYKLTLEFWRV